MDKVTIKFNNNELTIDADTLRVLLDAAECNLSGRAIDELDKTDGVQSTYYKWLSNIRFEGNTLNHFIRRKVDKGE